MADDEIQANEELLSTESESEVLQTVEETEANQDLANLEEAATQVEQEPEEFEVVLEGADEPTAESEKPKKPRGVKRLLAERRQDKDEIAALREENERLKANHIPAAPQAETLSAPIMPTDDELNYDETLIAQARLKYAKDKAEYDQKVAIQAAEQVHYNREHGTRIAQEQERVKSIVEAHYERAEKLNLPDFDDAEAALISNLDQNAVMQITQALPENSEKVVYYLGKNPQEALRIRAIWEQNPSAVLVELGGLAQKLKVKPKNSSQPPPAPETRITGSAPASKTSLEREIEEERKRIQSGEVRDMTKLHRLKAQARMAG